MNKKKLTKIGQARRHLQHKGDHCGPVAIGAPDKRALICCESLAENICKLVKKVS